MFMSWRDEVTSKRDSTPDFVAQDGEWMNNGGATSAEIAVIVCLIAAVALMLATWYVASFLG
jgi:hypothetical protein